MTLIGVGFVGVRTAEYDATVRLFQDVLGLTPIEVEEQQSKFRLRDGTVLEIYGPENAFHRFFTTGPVVGFRVTDFDESHARLANAGLELIADPQREDGMSWSHFRGPDGTIYEIIGPSRGE